MLREKVALGLVAAVLAAGCSSTHPAARPAPPPTTAPRAATATVRLPLTEVESRDAATAFTGRMLDALILPSDARLTTDQGPPDLLHAPLQWPGTKNLVQAHRVWKLRGDPRMVARFFEVHRPRGFVSNGNGMLSLGREHPRRAWQVDDRPHLLPPNVSNADLDLGITNIGGRVVLVRADAVVGWTAPRPTSEFVPARDRVVTVSVVHIYEHGRIGKRVVTTDPKLVQPIVQSFNALRVAPPPTIQPGGPAGSFRNVKYRVSFASSVSARPDIVAEVGPYGYSVGVNGGRGPALTDNAWSFATLAAHVLGLTEPHWG